MLFTRRNTGMAVAAVTASLLLAACSSSSSGGGGTPKSSGASGGTLKLVGDGDVDTLDPSGGYYDVTYTLDRAYIRQLYTYPNTTSYQASITPVPDLATALPAITNNGKTYTIQIRPGAMWSTTPARAVTAQDFVRGIERLCNPVYAPAPAGYFQNLIAGMDSFCKGELALGAKVTAPQLKSYIDKNANSISGLQAVNATTIKITLVQPAADFVNILALPFASPVPEEYLNYLPSSAQLAQHTLADGPYEISSYSPGKSIDLIRNPAWQSSSDPVRKGYVNAIQITEGVSDENSVQEQIAAGTQDMDWDQIVPTADLAHLAATSDPGLVIGPAEGYGTINPYLVINVNSPNNGGALRNVKVRQAIEYAINKTSVSKIYGGSVISQPLTQVIPEGNQGYIAGYDPYATPGSNGDPAKAKALLAQAGYKPGQITLKLPFRTNTVHPQVAQADQQALQAAGFKVDLISVEPNDFYTSYLQNPKATASGAWDIGEAGWSPDWAGETNGRSVIPPLFDGRNYGPGSTDYGDYDSANVDADIDKALAATSVASATKYWQAANRQIMEDAAIVPEGAQKQATYHSSRVSNCYYNALPENCDIANVSLSGN
ncbi:MAG TPA: ABC transporter substrate-binding protein [Mycobacteriales bacterium]|jgi:peptide/nickel transport system substrate-binding protein|nr:ABC transporter substrate-binding protein [Mycobacteriales bacterium]